MVSEFYFRSITDVKYTLEIYVRLTLVQAESLSNLVTPNKKRKKRLRTFSEKCHHIHHGNAKLISCHHSASTISNLVIPTERNPQQFQSVEKIVQFWSKMYVNQRSTSYEQYQ
jgi:hypothetical protein